MAKLTEREIEEIRRQHGIKPEHIGRQPNRNSKEARERLAERNK